MTRAVHASREDSVLSLWRGVENVKCYHASIYFRGFCSVRCLCLLPMTRIDSGVWLRLFSLLDYDTLEQCERVCREWKSLLKNTHFWCEYYALQWRGGVPLPKIYRTLSYSLIKKAVLQRVTLSTQLSTHATPRLSSNGNWFVVNESICSNFYGETVESVRSEQPLEPLKLCSSTQGSVCYFEAAIQGAASIGIASISSISERITYGLDSSNHVGWFPTSYGFHSDDGKVHYNDGTSRPGGQCLEYSRPWGSTVSLRDRTRHCTVVGCCLIPERSQVFFTINGSFLGFVSVSVAPGREYAAAVSLHHNGDSAELNFGRTPFLYDIEHYIPL